MSEINERTMDPERYVFPKIDNPLLKAAASTALFAGVVTAARLLVGRGTWMTASGSLPGWVCLACGYGIFLYASLKAWQATREKTAVEDPKRMAPTRLLDTGVYARVRHPMYGAFILANAGLGLAAGSVYGLGFSLLSWLLFSLNGVFEERAALMPMFGEVYRDYMRRVPARYFTPGQWVLLVAALGMSITLILLPKF